jgi:hypothetical protein
MKRIRDIEEYYEDDYDEEQHKRPRQFRENKPEPEKKRKWDREHNYDRPTDYDDYR